MLDKQETISAQINGEGNIVVQNSDNTTITIDMNNIVELRKQISNLHKELSIFDPKILQVMQHKIVEAGIDKLPEIDANIYFSLDFITNGIERGMGMSVTITNLTKEHRYFTQPTFHLSQPFKGADSFILTTPIGNPTQFPARLEYGQPVTVHYSIGNGQISFLREVIAQNEKASLSVVSSTTVGEIYRSNEQPIREIISYYEKIYGKQMI